MQTSLKPITDRAEYSSLIRPYMKKGILTNCFDSPDSILSDIKHKALYYTISDGAILIIHQRELFYKLSFYAPENACPTLFLKDDLPIICEIAHKNNFEPFSSLCKSLNLKKTHSRVRYTIPHNPLKTPLSHITIKEEASDHDLIKKHFDPLIGCIPTGDITCLCGYIDNELAGILHFENNEIRHLVTKEEFRGKGVGKSLVYAFSLKLEKNIKVWTLSENFSARSVYESCGGIADGLVSHILTGKN